MPKQGPKRQTPGKIQKLGSKISALRGKEDAPVIRREADSSGDDYDQITTDSSDDDYDQIMRDLEESPGLNKHIKIHIEKRIVAIQHRVEEIQKKEQRRIEKNPRLTMRRKAQEKMVQLAQEQDRFLALLVKLTEEEKKETKEKQKTKKKGEGK